MKSLVPKFLRKDKLSKGVSERTTDTTRSVVPSENLPVFTVTYVRAYFLFGEGAAIILM